MASPDPLEFPLGACEEGCDRLDQARVGQFCFERRRLEPEVEGCLVQVHGPALGGVGGLAAAVKLRGEIMGALGQPVEARRLDPQVPDPARQAA